MKTPFLYCALLLAALLSCDRMEPDVTVRRSRVFPHHEGGGRKAGSSGGEAPDPVPGPGWYLTAVDYPAGYDWRRDSARADIRGRLLLLRLPDSPSVSVPAAFDTVLALEAGKGRAVSLDPDRHHFTGGHLYTECITELGTVYRRDGQTIHIAREREYVRGILARGEDLYVLSQRLDNGGFILRRNWKPLLTRDGGRLHGSAGDPAFGRSGALFPDLNRVCFFYEDPAGQWILVRDGKEEVVTLPPQLTHLYDISCIDGDICLLCRIRQREPVLYVGSKKYDLATSLTVPAQKTGFRLLRDRGSDGQVRFIGTFRLNWNQQLFTGLWSPKTLLATKNGRCDWLDEDTFLCRENGRIVAAGQSGMEYPLDESGGWKMMMPSCAYVGKDGLRLALTPVGGLSGTGPDAPGADESPVGQDPVLWAGGRVIPLAVNGFLTSVTRID